MELGLQKRRSSWCDDEGLVWYPCRSWGGQNGVNFPPRLLIFVRAVNCNRCGDFKDAMAMIQFAVPWYIYWSEFAESLYPYIYFQQVYLLLSSDAIEIFSHVLLRVLSPFRWQWSYLVQVCSPFGDLQCSVRAILGFDVKGSQFTDAVINISTSAQVCLLLLASVSAHVKDSCIWHWVIKCYLSFHVAYVTPPDFKPSKWQGGPIAPVQYFPYMQVHHA